METCHAMKQVVTPVGVVEHLPQWRSPSLFSLPWGCLGKKARSSVQSHPLTVSFGLHQPLPAFPTTAIFPIALVGPTTLHYSPGLTFQMCFPLTQGNKLFLTHSTILEWEKRTAPLSKIDANANSDLKTAPSLGKLNFSLTSSS